MPLPEFSLEGQVFVVTGGGRGLGVALTGAIIEAGAKKVYSIDLLPEPHEDWYRVKRALKDRGDRIVYFGDQDVTDDTGIEKIFEEAVQMEGRLDGLVCSQGLMLQKETMLQDTDDMRKVLEVNVMGGFVCARTFARHAKALGTGGSIVFIASISGRICNEGVPCIGLNSSKAAIIQMARNMACEWAHLDIRVNTLSPGDIRSTIPRARYEKDPAAEKEVARHNPMGRVSEPEEYRGAIVFMLSNASSYMTGSDLVIDGGRTAW